MPGSHGKPPEGELHINDCRSDGISIQTPRVDIKFEFNVIYRGTGDATEAGVHFRTACSEAVVLMETRGALNPFISLLIIGCLLRCR